MFAGAHVVDLILVLIGAEAALIYALRRWHAARESFAPFAWTLASGASLLLALRASLVNAAWFWVAACLVAALITHLVDLSQRLR